MPRFLPRSLLVTLGSAALYLATFDRDLGAPDENQRFRLAVELAKRGPAALAHSGGLSRYPPLLSVLAALPVKLGLSLDGGHDGLWCQRMAVGVSLVACIVLVPMIFAIARAFGLSERQSAIASLIFAVTNPVWPYSKRFFSEPLSAALALGAFTGVILFIRAGRRWPLAAALVCVALLPLNSFFVPCAVSAGLLALALVERRWSLLALVAGVSVVGVGLLVGSLMIRFGSLAGGGYGNETFRFQVLDGLHGLLFGWGRSMFLFAPMTFLALFGWRSLWQKSRGVAIGALVATAVCLVIVACWWCWWGGVCWGPRLILPILPVASLGALPVLEKPGKLAAAGALLVAVWGLWVQFLGTSFSQDYAIYFWMEDGYRNERLAWFDFNHSSLVTLPPHFRLHPWAVSNTFLRRIPTGPSTIQIDRKPVKQVHIVHRGDDQYYSWTITDIYAVVNDGNGERRVPAGRLGASLQTYNHRNGAGALDGDPRTNWSSGSKRQDGMDVTLEFAAVHTDIVRLELEHAPSEHDFPSGLAVSIRPDDGAWSDVPAHAALPRLEWDPTIWVLITLAVLLLSGAVLPPRKEELASAVASASGVSLP